MACNSIITVKENTIVKVPECYSLFCQEVLILKMLQGHKNFPVLIDYDLSTMEIHLKKYKPINVKLYKNKICDAVNFLHRMGIIHADLKPDNIMLDDESDEPIIIDFGNSNFDIQETFEWTGTKGFIPPPCYKTRESHSYDVWSLSVMFDIPVPNRPSNRPTARQLKYINKKHDYHHDTNYLVAHHGDSYGCKDNYFLHEVEPVFNFTLEQNDRIVQFYKKYKNPRMTLLALSFSHLPFETMEGLTRIILGHLRRYNIEKIDVPRYNVLRWMKKMNTTNYHQVLWSIMLSGSIQNLRYYPTISFNESWIVPVSPCFEPFTRNSTEKESLKQYMLTRMKKDLRVKANLEMLQ